MPSSIRARQLEGLALRRLGRFQEAIDVLSELKAAGHQDPETLGMLAAAWFGRYEQTDKKIHLRKSRELYRTAFHADPDSSYTGINAASKSLFLGEADEASKFAEAVKPLVQHASDGEDFWAACTLGEVQLLTRDIEAAAVQYQRVVDKHPARIGDLKGTRDQARAICEAHDLPDEDRRKVLAPFDMLLE